MKTLKNTDPKIEPWGAHWQMAASLMQPHLLHLWANCSANVLWASLCAGNFIQEGTVGNSTGNFAEIQMHHIYSLDLVN